MLTGSDGHDVDNLPEPFRLEVKPDRDVVRVLPVGDIDIATVGIIRDQLSELTAAGFRRVVVDLRGVTFVDSTGLQLLLQTYASAQADGWELAIIDGSPAVARALELTGLGAALPIVDAHRLDVR